MHSLSALCLRSLNSGHLASSRSEKTTPSCNTHKLPSDIMVQGHWKRNPSLFAGITVSTAAIFLDTSVCPGLISVFYCVYIHTDPCAPVSVLCSFLPFTVRISPPLSLKPLDIEFMKRLHDKVNVIPLIAKADTLTPEECQLFKKQVCVFVSVCVRSHINLLF